MEIKNMNLAQLERAEAEMNQYWKDILARDPHSYSFPHHQKNAIDKRRKELLG